MMLHVLHHFIEKKMSLLYNEYVWKKTRVKDFTRERKERKLQGVLLSSRLFDSRLLLQRIILQPCF